MPQFTRDFRTAPAAWALRRALAGQEEAMQKRDIGMGGLVGLFIAGTVLGGCAANGGEAEPGEKLTVSCDGKCDGLGSTIRSYWRSLRNVDSGDLINVTAGFATDELNDQLAVGGATARFDAPELYTLPEDAEGDLTLKNIESLTHGLTLRYGENELSTTVNRVRQNHLRNSRDVVFADAAFAIRGSIDHGWSFQTGGLGAGDGWASVGFSAGAELESRVVAAFPTELRATGGSMLGALRESRGFVLPRSVEDLEAMKPGESFALSGDGALGVNLGAGLPILVREPVNHVTYNIVLSAALRARLEGSLDVQVARLEGDEIVVDVGTSRIYGRSAALALYDGWGVTGFIELDVELAGRTVNLGRFVERALEKQLDRQINLVDGRIERSSREARISVARFRFRLSELDEAGRAALAQTLKADVRLSQLLSAQGHAGVVAELDIMRAGRSATSYAGIDILGMKFFREEIAASGSTVIQTPGGVRTLMFDSLHRDRGWFFSSHGFTRVGLSGLTFDPRDGGSAEGEANLHLSIVEGDEFMQRDKMLDHLDALVLAVAGAEAFEVLERGGNELERHIEAFCPNSRAFDPCRTDVLANDRTRSLEETTLADFRARLGHLEEQQFEMVMAAARQRIIAQKTLEPAASLVGPKASVVLSYRLDDAALQEITARSGDEFASAVEAYLAVAEIDRGDSESEIAADRRELRDDERATVQALAAIFDQARRDYEAVSGVERARVDGLGEIGAQALEIRIPVDRERGPLFDEATVQSLAQARSEVATRLFDALVDTAGDLPGLPEQVAAYSLLALTPAHLHDVRLDVDMDLSDGFSQDFTHYRTAGYAPFDIYAKGGAVAPVDGGVFNLDALMRVD
jgi:hypothetical protein